MIAQSVLLFVCLIVGELRLERIGARLLPTMQLIYASGGVESAWTVDSVARDTTLGGRSPCVRIRLRTRSEGAPETRAYCTDSTMMFTWDDRTQQLRASRPLSAGGALELPQRDGGQVRFESAASTVEQIGTQSLEVIPTTVTTRDSTGTIVRRLRERFSVGLATATGGVFEVPDSSQAGGWRTVRSFEMTAIRIP
jgi:hypothetical protein